MSFTARRLTVIALVVSLFIQIHIAANAYAALQAKIAFTRWEDDSREICVMDADGDNEVRLTDDPGFDAEPSWSPDGNRIAFNRGHDIYIMDSDGRNLTILTGGREPAWSPDGTKIAFTRLKR